VPRNLQVSVIGYDDELCTEAAYDTAQELGKEIAKAGLVLVTGGRQGIMRAVSQGAKEMGGMTIGVVPWESTEKANEYCDAVIATGVGQMRNFFVVYSGDAVIVVGGGAGTMIEVVAAYLKSKPIISIRGTGGVADRLADQYVDERQLVKIIGVSDPSEAVKKVLQLLHHHTNMRPRLSLGERNSA